MINRTHKKNAMRFLLGPCAALALITLGIGSASAHPLHGAGVAGGLVHPFAGLDHLLAAVAVGMWAARLGGRSTWLVPAGFVTAMLLGCGVALAGFGTGAMEPMIAASVAALGLILVCRLASNAAIATAVVACFALFHGMAHATALGTPALPFVLGLAAATAVLHAAGVLAARALPALIPLAGAALAAVGAWWMAASVL
jgi:urease accessory protein